VRVTDRYIRQFAKTILPPVLRQIECRTGAPASAVAISMHIYESHRTTLRRLNDAERLGYVQRIGNGKATRWALVPTFPKPQPRLPVVALTVHESRPRQLELPFAFAA
jgi:hypothetical protein